MDRRDVAEYIGLLTDEEFADLTAEARGDNTKGTHVAGLGQQPSMPNPVTAAEGSGDWKQALALKAAQLAKLSREQP